MKTILVDAWNTFITEAGVDLEIKAIVDRFPNPKIIVTNANEEEQAVFGMVNLPYPLYSMGHHPDKTDPYYFECLLKTYGLKAEDVVYLEHNADAVASAASVGIKSHWYDYELRDLKKLEEFLDRSV